MEREVGSKVEREVGSKVGSKVERVMKLTVD